MGTEFCLGTEHALLLSRTPLLLHALAERLWQRPVAKGAAGKETTLLSS